MDGQVTRLRAGDRVRLVGGTRVMVVQDVYQTPAGVRCLCQFVNGLEEVEAELHREQDLEPAA